MSCRNWDPLRKWNWGSGRQPSGLFNTCPRCGEQGRLRQRSHLLPERQSGGGNYPLERIQQNARRKKGEWIVPNTVVQIQMKMFIIILIFLFVIWRLSKMERNTRIWTKWPSCSTSMRTKTRKGSWASWEFWQSLPDFDVNCHVVEIFSYLEFVSAAPVFSFSPGVSVLIFLPRPNRLLIFFKI